MFTQVLTARAATANVCSGKTHARTHTHKCEYQNVNTVSNSLQINAHFLYNHWNIPEIINILKSITAQAPLTKKHRIPWYSIITHCEGTVWCDWSLTASKKKPGVEDTHCSPVHQSGPRSHRSHHRRIAGGCTGRCHTWTHPRSRTQGWGSHLQGSRERGGGG